MEILVEKRRRGARSNQKLKILYLAKILLDNTDANHDITLQEIIDKLSANNVTAERKSLYDDIARLDEFGIKIKKTQYGKTYHYQVVKRDFELAELKLLVDSVAAAKFITEEKSNELIKKIEHLTSKHNATMLQRQVYVAGRVKSMNNGIMENVDAIHTAIAENSKISFQYFQWNVKKEAELKRDGKRYEVSPWGLSWDDEYYYSMSWRTVVISSSAKLDYQMGYLIVRNQDVVKIHISEISILMIETTSVSLTAALLCELTKKKIKVVFCDEKRNPSSELIPYYGSHDTSMKVRKQIAWSEDIKTSVWTEIVTEKIRKQAENLERWDRTEAQMLYEYITQIEFGDATNREGHAAKVYFNALFGLDFTRTAENSINAALNYGYSLLLSTCARETALNGYITQIGLFHDNIFNQFNLASDLMEPFRPIVDNLVKTMHPDKFEHDEKVEILKMLQKEMIIAGRKECVNNAMKIYCRSIFDALNEGDISLIKFYKDEL